MSSSVLLISSRHQVALEEQDEVTINAHTRRAWILVKSTVSGQMTYGREKSGRLARNLFRTPFPPPPSISLPGISISSLISPCPSHSTTLQFSSSSPHSSHGNGKALRTWRFGLRPTGRSERIPLQPSLPSPSIQSQLHHGLSSSSRPILRVCRDGIVRLWYVPSGLELAILICLIASVSPPAWDQVNFLSATAGGTKTVFGVLGECVKGGSCTHRNVGYNLMVNGAT